jgi:SDR family mycofactocin-dependent oxidoreductase
LWTLDGKVALVTGAARGQGRAFARRLASEGADVAIFDLCTIAAAVGYPAATPDDLAETADEVRSAGGKVITRIGDVRDQSALDEIVSATFSELGGLDVVVANAGVASWGSLWELSDENWRTTIDINLTGVWHTFKAAIPAMIEQGKGGSIVAISSVAGLKALPGQAHYVASKHAVVGLVRAAAVELGPHRIRVNSIHPWAVDTAMAHGTDHEEILAANPHYLVSYGSILTEPALAKPDDIADAVLFLASDASRFITGSQLTVDAGATTV